MKKAIAITTIRLGRINYPKGTVFTSPYPHGVQTEIDLNTGTIIEQQGGPVPVKEPVKDSVKKSAKPEKAEKSKAASSGMDAEAEKQALIDYALKQFGVKLDARHGLDKIREDVADMDRAAKEAGFNDADGADDTDADELEGI